MVHRFAKKWRRDDRRSGPPYECHENLMIDAHFSSHPSIIMNGFQHAGIKACIEQLTH